MNDPDEAKCKICGAQSEWEVTHHQDGRVTKSPRCSNPTCANGRSGLFSVRRLDKSGRVVAATRYSTIDHFVDYAEGHEPPNEQNVPPVAAAFMAAINRDFGGTYNRFELAPPDARKERGYDFEMFSPVGPCPIRFQVTRPLQKETYAQQGRRRRRDLEASTADVAKWIAQRIEEKQTRSDSTFALVIDGLNAQFVGLFSDQVLATVHSADLATQGWHSIWIIGVAGARHVWGEHLP